MQGLHPQPRSKPKTSNKKPSNEWGSDDEDDDITDPIKSKKSTANKIPKICLYCRKYPVAFECKNPNCVQLVKRRYLCTACDRNLHQGITTQDHERMPVSHSPPPKRKSPKPVAAKQTPKKKRKNPYLNTDEEDDEIHTEVPENPPSSPPQFIPKNRSRSPSPIPHSNNDGKHATFSSSSHNHVSKDVMI